MTCDRCDHVEVVDSYATSCLGWTHLKIGTFKVVLFPERPAVEEAASAEAMAFAIERLNKLLEVGR
jgi:hypothetical protein